MLEDVNDEIPLFTEREQETVLEGEPIGTKVTQVNAIDKDGTYPNNRVRNFFLYYILYIFIYERYKILYCRKSCYAPGRRGSMDGLVTKL